MRNHIDSTITSPVVANYLSNFISDIETILIENFQDSNGEWLTNDSDISLSDIRTDFSNLITEYQNNVSLLAISSDEKYCLKSMFHLAEYSHNLWIANSLY